MTIQQQIDALAETTGLALDFDKDGTGYKLEVFESSGGVRELSGRMRKKPFVGMLSAIAFVAELAASEPRTDGPNYRSYPSYHRSHKKNEK